MIDLCPLPYENAYVSGFRLEVFEVELLGVQSIMDA
jgi:hypothetical protein